MTSLVMKGDLVKSNIVAINFNHFQKCIEYNCYELKILDSPSCAKYSNGKKYQCCFGPRKRLGE